MRCSAYTRCAQRSKGLGRRLPSGSRQLRRCQPSGRQRQAVASRAASQDEGETYDVYVASPRRLSEGIEKHTISVFVADESGIINRVAGVFARRGMNIESLAVGLNIDKALFTINVNGTASAVSNMVKQLAKLVKVRYVEDVTHERRIDRELALFKVGAPHGAARSSVLELTTIFRGRVVDVGPLGLTVALSGDVGKVFAFEQSLRAFGLVELARTGRITLQMADANLDMPGNLPYAPARPSAAPNVTATGAVDQTPSGPAGADVYAADSAPKSGPWTVRSVLDPVFDVRESQGFKAHTVLIEVDDIPGVLNEVTGVVARRGYNIQSLAVGNSETVGRSRITTVLPGQEGGVGKLIKQLEKLVVVQTVRDLTGVPHVARELMLIKVRCTAMQRSEVKDIADIFDATVAHLTTQTMTLEVIGTEGRMQNMQEVLAPYGILEVARTGRIALARESKVDSVLLEASQLGSYV